VQISRTQDEVETRHHSESSLTGYRLLEIVNDKNGMSIRFTISANKTEINKARRITRLTPRRSFCASSVINLSNACHQATRLLSRSCFDMVRAVLIFPAHQQIFIFTNAGINWVE
jgi:hypothetical protein